VRRSRLWVVMRWILHDLSPHLHFNAISKVIRVDLHCDTTKHEWNVSKDIKICMFRVSTNE